MPVVEREKKGRKKATLRSLGHTMAVYFIFCESMAWRKYAHNSIAGFALGAGHRQRCLRQ